MTVTNGAGLISKVASLAEQPFSSITSKPNNPAPTSVTMEPLGTPVLQVYVYVPVPPVTTPSNSASVELKQFTPLISRILATKESGCVTSKSYDSTQFTPSMISMV